MELPDPDHLPEEIDLAAGAAWMSSAEPPLVVDVREPFEHALAHLEPSVLLPLGEVAARVDELPRERPLLILCHHGGRSLRAARYLRARGLAATSLRGGIDRWSLEIDPAVPRY